MHKHFVIALVLVVFGEVIPMWISRRRYEALQDRIRRSEGDIDMVLRKMAEFYTEQNKQSARLERLERSVYGKPVQDGKKVLHG